MLDATNIQLLIDTHIVHAGRVLSALASP